MKEDLKLLQEELKNENSIHLWTYRLNLSRASANLDNHLSILSSEEMKKGKKIIFEKERVRYRATRAFIRIVLSIYFDKNPAMWKFSENAHGKPSLANDQENITDIRFNISHTSRMIALALNTGYNIGVDIEKKSQPVDYELIKRHCLTSREVDYIDSFPENKKNKKFLEIWTLKEAYTKAKGEGLSIPLTDIHFERHASKHLRFYKKESNYSSHWSFWQYEFNSHIVSLCLEREGYTPDQVRIFDMKSEDHWMEITHRAICSTNVPF